MPVAGGSSQGYGSANPFTYRAQRPKVDQAAATVLSKQKVRHCVRGEAYEYSGDDRAKKEAESRDGWSNMKKQTASANASRDRKLRRSRSDEDFGWEEHCAVLKAKFATTIRSLHGEAAVPLPPEVGKKCRFVPATWTRKPSQLAASSVVKIYRGTVTMNNRKSGRTISQTDKETTKTSMAWLHETEKPKPPPAPKRKPKPKAAAPRPPPPMTRDQELLSQE